MVHEGLGVHYVLKAFTYQGGKSVEMLRAKFMEEGQVLARCPDARTSTVGRMSCRNCWRQILKSVHRY